MQSKKIDIFEIVYEDTMWTILMAVWVRKYKTKVT